jgi:hypothetical protein
LSSCESQYADTKRSRTPHGRRIRWRLPGSRPRSSAFPAFVPWRSRTAAASTEVDPSMGRQRWGLRGVGPRNPAACRAGRARGFFGGASWCRGSWKVPAPIVTTALKGRGVAWEMIRKESVFCVLRH